MTRDDFPQEGSSRPKPPLGVKPLDAGAPPPPSPLPLAEQSAPVRVVAPATVTPAATAVATSRTPERPARFRNFSQPPARRDTSREWVTVKWYNLEKGYGFVIADRDQKELFFHVRTLQQAGIDPLTIKNKLTRLVVRREPSTRRPNEECVSEIVVPLANDLDLPA